MRHAGSGFVTGLSGFAFGMVAAAIWVYALPPPQASALIAAYAFLVQGYAVWKFGICSICIVSCRSSSAARWEFRLASWVYAWASPVAISASAWGCC